MACEKCPVCQVSINKDVVQFSFGKPGTRDRLWARVCQYVEKQKPGCINKSKDFTHSPKEVDFYYEEL